MSLSSNLLLLPLICMFCYTKADSVDRGLRNGVMLKMLREMVNQTNADTLNLPANATSIRENITDTFSCENKTYGYYADVDNECQVFHVCLTSQGSSGRNVTYRWSFICPKETLFNQEVLTCTRPRDAIDCEDSPMYYDVNMDIGKISNDTESDANKDNMDNKENTPNKITNNAENVRIKDRRKGSNKKKQNIIMQNLLKEVEKEKLQLIDFRDMEEIDEGSYPVEETFVANEDDNKRRGTVNVNVAKLDKTKKPSKVNGMSIIEMMRENHKNAQRVEVPTGMYNGGSLSANAEEETSGEENERLAMERSFRRRGKNMRRGSYKFKFNSW